MINANSAMVSQRCRSKGYTLLEVLVVLALLVLIVGVTTPMLLGRFGEAKVDAARVQVNALAGSIEVYMIDNGRVPSGEQGLQALVEKPPGAPSWRGPYVSKASQLNDPWGVPYRYKAPSGNAQFEVFTLGSDNAPGGDGDATDVSSLD